MSFETPAPVEFEINLPTVLSNLLLHHALYYSRHMSRPMFDEHGGEGWGIYGSPVEDYEETFRRLLGDRDISDHLKGKEKPMVVDFLASTAAIRDIFAQLGDEHEKTGIAVGLTDMRSDEQKRQESELGIYQVTGDLTYKKTFQELKTILNGKKADVILQRGYAGVDNMPKHGVFYQVAISQLWEMLNPDDGLLLMQIPSERSLSDVGISLYEWILATQDSGVNVQYDMVNSVIRLDRTYDSPSALPSLLD